MRLFGISQWLSFRKCESFESLCQFLCLLLQNREYAFRCIKLFMTGLVEPVGCLPPSRACPVMTWAHGAWLTHVCSPVLPRHPCPHPHLANCQNRQHCMRKTSGNTHSGPVQGIIEVSDNLMVDSEINFRLYISLCLPIFFTAVKNKLVLSVRILLSMIILKVHVFNLFPLNATLYINLPYI